DAPAAVATRCAGASVRTPVDPAPPACAAPAPGHASPPSSAAAGTPGSPRRRSAGSSRAHPRPLPSALVETVETGAVGVDAHEHRLDGRAAAHDDHRLPPVPVDDLLQPRRAVPEVAVTAVAGDP